MGWLVRVIRVQPIFLHPYSQHLNRALVVRILLSFFDMKIYIYSLFKPLNLKVLKISPKIFQKYHNLKQPKGAH